MGKKREHFNKVLSQCWNCKHWEKYNDRCALKKVERKYDEDARRCRAFNPPRRAG